MSCFATIRTKAANGPCIWLLFYLFIAINDATSAVVTVTFCDNIQYIIEARNELSKAKELKNEWGKGVY
jgi:hypothetical protein